MKRLRPVVFVVVVIHLNLSSVAVAQTPQTAGGHVHYRDQSGPQASPSGALAPRLQNLGNHTFPVSTRNRQAQTFMNQGLNLAYGFNHAEAARALDAATRDIAATIMRAAAEAA